MLRVRPVPNLLATTFGHSCIGGQYRHQESKSRRVRPRLQRIIRCHSHNLPHHRKRHSHRHRRHRRVGPSMVTICWATRTVHFQVAGVPSRESTSSDRRRLPGTTPQLTRLVLHPPTLSGIKQCQAPLSPRRPPYLMRKGDMIYMVPSLFCSRFHQGETRTLVLFALSETG